MRHEIIRMEHVNISRPGRHEIEDLNLIICRGYSMGVAGVENSKEILADFFEGKGTLARGRIYLDGQPWKPEGKRDFEDAGIFVISKDTVYMDSLDVSENLFLLRRNSLRKIRLNDKALHIQGRALLEKYDLPSDRDGTRHHTGGAYSCFAGDCVVFSGRRTPEAETVCEPVEAGRYYGYINR